MDVIEFGGSDRPRQRRWRTPALIVMMAAAGGVWLALSSSDHHPSASGAPSSATSSTASNAIPRSARPAVSPTTIEGLDLAASIDTGLATLPPRQDGQKAGFAIAAGEADGYGYPPLRSGQFLLDVVCVGDGKVQVQVNDSQGRALTEQLVLPCHTEVGSGDPKSVSFTTPGGAVTVLVVNLSSSASAIALDVSPRAG